MKKIIVLVMCAAFVLASALTLSSCSCNGSGSGNGSGKTVISQVDQKEAKNLKPAKAIIHGNISGNAAPEGWEVKPDEADYITYIKKTEAYETDPDSCPYIQFGADTVAAEDMFSSARSLLDTKGENYDTDEIEIGGTKFFVILSENGVNSAFGTVNGATMVINYKGIDLSDQAVKDIISGIEISAK